jgi:arginine/lysine/ornithine decarboxylase
MWSPCNPDSDYEDFYKAIIRIMGHRNNFSHEASEIIHGKTKNKTEDAVCTFRYNAVAKYQPYETLFMDTETVKVSKSICGRIAADTSVHCPPAILPIVPGEIIDENTLAILKYNNINQITVIRL